MPPPLGGPSGVRLFNLSPDTPDAFLAAGGKMLASGVACGLGSQWATTAANASASYTVSTSAGGAALATAIATAPTAPRRRQERRQERVWAAYEDGARRPDRRAVPLHPAAGTASAAEVMAIENRIGACFVYLYTYLYLYTYR